MKYLRGILRPVSLLLIAGSFLITRGVRSVFAEDTAKKDPKTKTMPEVLVTSQQNDKRKSYKPAKLSSSKYTGDLVDTPQTVNVVPQAVIQDQNATTLRETLRNVPGISMQAGEGGAPAGDQLSIRGFSARNDIFVDGVRDFGGYTRDPFNLEQVEVVKGPASSYTGRGSTGGSINQVSKEAQMDPFYRGSVGFGSAFYKRTTLDLNQPVSESPVPGTAVRLNGMWTKGDNPGREETKYHRWGVAPSVAFGLGTATRFVLDYFYMGQNNEPDYGVPWVPGTNNVLTNYRDYPSPASWHNYYGLKERDYEHTATHLATAKLEHDFSDEFTLRNQLRYGYAKRDSIVTAPRFVNNNTTDIARTDWKSRDQIDTILDYQIDLTSRVETFGLDHTLVTGFEFIREIDLNRTRLATGPNSQNTNLFEPNAEDPYTEDIQPTDQKAKADTKTFAAYAFDTINVNEYLDLVGGLRGDYFNVDFGPAVGNTAQRIDRFLSWNAGVVLHPLPNGSVYFSYGTSTNPTAEGLVLSSAANALTNLNLKPERSRTYEIGTKWDVFEKRLALTSAVFRTDKTNARTTDPGTAAGTADDVVAVSGLQRVYGWEIGATGNITKDWKIYSAFTLLRSEIVKSLTPTEAGKPLANTPRHSFNVWTTYMIRPFNTEVGFGSQFVDWRFASQTGTTAHTRKAPEYWVFNAMLAYHMKKHMIFRLNFNNIFNQEYIDQMSGGHFIPGAGRSVTFTTDFDF